MEKILEEIKEFADKAHGNQLRKYTPDRYIVHPVRVMLLCREYTEDIPILAAALLHDVLEDTSITEQEMKDFLISKMELENAIKTLKYVIELTDVYTKKDYPQLNRKQRKAKEFQRLKQISGEAQTIKYADIIDNSKEIVDHDPSFAPVFLSEYKSLLKDLTEGNRELYDRAKETVNEAMP
ncbi:HD domain-containing protein [Albibacterium indicum]|uniref:HD domain-containing protein n=1 Tax=Albibacterium indicum TaxID=2292082 RepID=UPI000E540F1E|nr:HD domain-containing protein [Pedobacter indicus]